GVLGEGVLGRELVEALLVIANARVVGDHRVLGLGRGLRGGRAEAERAGSAIRAALRDQHRDRDERDQEADDGQEQVPVPQVVDHVAGELLNLPELHLATTALAGCTWVSPGLVGAGPLGEAPRVSPWSPVEYALIAKSAFSVGEGPIPLSWRLKPPIVSRRPSGESCVPLDTGVTSPSTSPMKVATSK